MLDIHDTLLETALVSSHIDRLVLLLNGLLVVTKLSCAGDKCIFELIVKIFRRTLVRVVVVIEQRYDITPPWST